MFEAVVVKVIDFVLVLILPVDVLDTFEMMVVTIEAVLLVLDRVVVGGTMVSGDEATVGSVCGGTESLAGAGAVPIIGMFKVLIDGAGGHCTLGAGGRAKTGAGTSPVGTTKAALHSEIISANEAANGALSVAKQIMQVVMGPVKQGHSPAL